MGGIALGAALGVATFTNHIPGKWKWASGVASAASLALGLMTAKIMHENQTDDRFEIVAQSLERSPELRQLLAEDLSSKVTAEHIQTMGIERAVAHHSFEFVMNFVKQGLQQKGLLSLSSGINR